MLDARSLDQLPPNRELWTTNLERVPYISPHTTYNEPQTMKRPPIRCSWRAFVVLSLNIEPRTTNIEPRVGGLSLPRRKFFMR